jgi:hypothetical protein
VVFPSDSPSHATGPGAIVWSSSGRCAGGTGAHVTAVAADEVPTGVASADPSAPDSLEGAVAVSASPHGQIAIAGARSSADGSDELLLQGSARGPLSPLATAAGTTPPLALTSAYLGDLASLSRTSEGHGREGLALEVERYFATGLTVRGRISTPGPEPLQALTVAMDYRSDAMAVWAKAGALYARDLPASGVVHPTQRLAATGSQLKLAALLSDDNRGIIAWSEQLGGRTSVYVDLSSSGVSFGPPRLLERFPDPDGLSPPSGSPSLVRLSSESVMMAWAGSADGHWVLRAAPVDLGGLKTINTIAAPGSDVLLAGLAPGPDGDALALWTQPQQTAGDTPEPAQEAIFAARGIDAYPGTTMFGPSEEVAAPGPNSEATVAVDPGDDRALAAWRVGDGQIDYSIRSVAGP